MIEAWRPIVKNVVDKAAKLLIAENISEGVGAIDYAAIFPQSENEYSSLMLQFGKEGNPVKIVPTGTVFQLHESLKTEQGFIPRIRVRIFDSEKTQRGYVDFNVQDYKTFKNKYVGLGVVSITANKEGEEMLMVENEEVIVYFPEVPLGKELKENNKI